MKRLSAIFSILFTAALLCVSCSETKEADDHANWQGRNAEFISGIAARCSDKTPQTASKGEIVRLISYKLNPESKWGDDSYVYCEILDKGDGTVSPNFSDSVRVNYRVRLMPTANYPEGQVMDQSFKTATLNPSANIPASFRVSGLVDGVSTALMYMHCGDFWRLYIPQSLGYGDQARNSIPAYSALIFEVNLTEIAPTGQELSPR